jgi:DNA-binding NarL/FixJ family response regulator
LSAEISGLVVEAYTQHLNSTGLPSDPEIPLSPREREVLQLLAEGHATRRIASVLHVSVKTIETHRRQIMDKLDLHSLAELTKYAIRAGLTTLEP